ncbi:YrhC family protein [Ornithinibacillus salinisoli]|uniref:YrhC family protein n=1 Tax=Ornithinibacillus salinisoli TaxID=1848459 RepID=A0ABW4W3U5_9BACI
MNSKTKLQSKLKDYQRFIITLILLSTYLFLGGVNNVFVYPSENGEKLLYLSGTLLIVGLVFSIQYVKIKRIITENERT